MSLNWFYDRYGSRRSFVLSKWHQLLNAFGKYKQDDIPWHAIERLVFVCKGNICRSAFAEAVAKSLGIKAISAGIHAVEGAPANEQAILTAKTMGYDLAMHHTTPIMYPILSKSDLLIAMEPWQATLISQHLAHKYYTTLLGLWGKPIRPYIADPFGRSPAYFENCFKYIEKSVVSVANKIGSAESD